MNDVNDVNDANDSGQLPFVNRFGGWVRTRAPIFWSNALSAAGSVIAIVAVALLAVMFLVYVYNVVLDRESNPYVDLVAFMVLPAVLIAGVVLIVAGNLVRRRRLMRGDVRPSTLEKGGPALVKRVLIVGGIAFAFLFGLGLFSYEAYHFTDSNQFCSSVCHEVMAPEAAVYAASPHASVHCVSCHIGPGASWFVRAKLSGLRQVSAVMQDSYHRPIHTPIEGLRPARETCEVCHWPERFHGSRLVARQHFEEDRENSKSVTALVMHVGGPGTPDSPGGGSGIHWHVDPHNQVRYRHLDRERLEIVEVVLRTPEGEMRYLRDGADPDSTAGSWRTMDCLDCHNRPTHIYREPDEVMDLAFATRRLDSEVPWLRAAGERALREVTPGEDTAALVAEHLRAVYTEDHPEDLAALEAVLEPTAEYLASQLELNVWPQMNIEWGTYRSHLSHFDADGELAPIGCFRCHDDELANADGEVVSQDCEACHTMLAWRERDWEGLAGLAPGSFTRR